MAFKKIKQSEKNEKCSKINQLNKNKFSIKFIFTNFIESVNINLEILKKMASPDKTEVS